MDVKEFIVGEGIKKIYSSKIGFLTFRCLPIKITCNVANNAFGMKNDQYNSYYYRFSLESVDRNNIYSCFITPIVVNGRSSRSYNFYKLSTPLIISDEPKNTNERFFCYSVKKENSYYQIQHIQEDFVLESSYGQLTNKQAYNWLTNNKWEEDNEHELINFQFYHDIKIGDKLFYHNAVFKISNMSVINGEVTVDNILPYVSDNQAYFVLVDAEKNKLTIPYKGEKLFKLVDKKHQVIDEYEPLRKTSNELLLQPFVRACNNGFNVFWREIEDAALYNVDIYTENSQIESDRKIYKMLTKTIDRGSGFLALDNLSPGRYLIRVIAENRGGEIIAESSAIIVSVIDAIGSLTRETVERLEGIKQSIPRSNSVY